MHRGFADWGGNIAALAAVIAVNGLASGLPINGQTTGDVSAKYPSLFTPAGLTFGIWGLIYLSLLIFIIYQALPAGRKSKSVAEIGMFFKANCLANIAWIFAWHYDLLALSVLLMFVILISLIGIYNSLNIVNMASGFSERITVQLPFSLYTGWITVATIANLSALQTGMGWDEVGLTAIDWTLLKLAIAGAIAATVILRRADMIFAAVVAWAAFGISIKQSATPAVAGAALTLTVLASLLIVAELFRRARSL